MQGGRRHSLGPREPKSKHSAGSTCSQHRVTNSYLSLCSTSRDTIRATALDTGLRSILWGPGPPGPTEPPSFFWPPIRDLAVVENPELLPE